MTTESRTSFAMAAMDFAGMFNAFFSEKPVAGFISELTSPEGQSTGGGVQARQHITMTHQVESKNLVVGSCNNVEKKVELRSYEYVAGQYKQRYGGEAFPVGRAEYEDLVKHFNNFFTSKSLTVSMIAEKKASAPTPAARAGKSSTGLIIGIVVGLLVVAAGLVYFFVFHQS